jgi:hypothetical protein
VHKEIPETPIRIQSADRDLMVVAEKGMGLTVLREHKSVVLNSLESSCLVQKTLLLALT